MILSTACTLETLTLRDRFDPKFKHMHMPIKISSALTAIIEQYLSKAAESIGPSVPIMIDFDDETFEIVENDILLLKEIIPLGAIVILGKAKISNINFVIENL